MGITPEQFRQMEARLNKNVKRHIQASPAVSDTKQCERAKTLASDCKGEAQGARPLHCRFTLRRKSLLDVDAKYSSVKDLLDCLTFSGVIRGDKEGQITLEVNQEKVNKGEPETTSIEVFDNFQQVGDDV